MPVHAHLELNTRWAETHVDRLVEEVLGLIRGWEKWTSDFIPEKMSSMANDAKAP